MYSHKYHFFIAIISSSNVEFADEIIKIFMS